jgi:antitoxin component YwqK of YwqJK toxin-antitoxin module
VRGVAQGQQKHWYENGRLASDGQYVDGYAEGLHTQWHENGQVYEEGTYQLGRRHGVFKRFDEDGVVERTQEWAQGDLVMEKRGGVDIVEAVRAIDNVSEPIGN